MGSSHYEERPRRRPCQAEDTHWDGDHLGVADVAGGEDDDKLDDSLGSCLFKRFMHPFCSGFFLDLLDSFPVLLIKVFGSETHLVEAVGVEDVLEWKGKGKVEEDLFQLSLPFGESEIQRSSPSICVAGGIFFIVPTGLEEFLDEGKKVKDEGVPHEVEGDGGPVVVAVLQQVVEGDAIGCHVRDRQDRVEEGKLCNLDHLDGHQEAKTFDNRSNFE